MSRLREAPVNLCVCDLWMMTSSSGAGVPPSLSVHEKLHALFMDSGTDVVTNDLFVLPLEDDFEREDVLKIYARNIVIRRAQVETISDFSARLISLPTTSSR